jgi:hypothetical protein
MLYVHFDDANVYAGSVWSRNAYVKYTVRVIKKSLYTTQLYKGCAGQTACPFMGTVMSARRLMESQDLRPKGVASCTLTFDATNVPLDGTFE